MPSALQSPPELHFIMICGKKSPHNSVRSARFLRYPFPMTLFVFSASSDLFLVDIEKIVCSKLPNSSSEWACMSVCVCVCV